MKIKLTKNIEKEIGFSTMCKYIFTLWQKYYKLIFSLVFSGIVAYLGYIWYEAFYGEPWSQQDKDNYIIVNSERINFDKEKYNETLEFIGERGNNFNSSLEEVGDIFY